MTEQLTPEHFLPHVSKPFRVHGWPHPFILEQVDVRQLEGWEKDRTARQPFNLIFRGPPGEVMREGLYTLQIEDRSSFDLYLMPVHTVQSDRQNYQAAFN
ncbi:hypothetical protein MesoLjLc_52910 [Mesorhizobium sp. L-8-10]|uniref:DUF6916 family protein n=1 Tax=Mesorhizobium sp. L-8-10 TaxID=2744523 RepID=UPI001928BA59|nr:hypothetical protein [Mesorhizobium sp. L-8-10]BCH33361.1 hypothetical protein MesoLjLc_52910 [Mesorhizobium sp. L-8-10]